MARSNLKRQADQNSISPDLINDLNKALELHQANELKEAEKLYKKAIATSQNQPDVVVMGAIFYQQIGKHKYVVTLLKKLLLKHPHNAKALTLLGKSHLELQQFEESLAILNRALEQNPGDSELTFYKGVCLLRMGQYNPAEQHLEQVRKQGTTLAEPLRRDLYLHLSDLMIARNDSESAVKCLREAMQENVTNYDILIRLSLALKESNSESVLHCLNAILAMPDRDEAKAIFARACKFGQAPRLVSEEMRKIISHCFASHKVNHQSLVIPWVSNCIIDPGNEDIKQLAETTDFDEFVALLEKDTTIGKFFEPFFLAGLTHIRADLLKTERLYTHLRRHYLLKLKAGDDLSNNEQSLLSAMAHQCFLNEYVFHLSDEETAFIQQTKQQLESIDEVNNEHASLILLYACYENLLTLSNFKQCLRLSELPNLGSVLEEQIEQPLEELRLRKTIKSIGAIENKISEDVRGQYEENPYPRWKTESIVTAPFIQMAAPEYRRKMKILIAGCGTGKHIMQVSNLYPDADYTAIDISYTSLSYAKRKLIEYGFDKNVTLRQCDILDVEKLGNEYDYMECCGVLHHMQDPLAGLKSLVKILKPGRRIKLAFYSKLARQNVFRAREFIKQQGIEPTTEGIRKFRKLITEEEFVESEHHAISRWTDFYSMSECRDLLFHFQEICYDLNEINDMLSKAGLTFQKFELNGPVLDAFAERFPGPEQMQDLSCWAQFEQENPDTFAAMYQFYAVKDE